MSLPLKKHALLNLNFWVKSREDIFHLLLPSSCLVCECEWKDNIPICSWCFEELKFTDFENYIEPTPLDRVFWGRVDLHASFALLHFEKNTSTQNLLHAIKYGNRPGLAFALGELIGQRIEKMNGFRNADLIIPVPLHPKKQFIRGYNQSEQLALGIGKILSLPVETKIVRKASHASSQTRKGRFQRWTNVDGNFLVKKGLPENMHIVIVDDVVTTGATLEAMILSIKQVYPKSIVSIISLALAS